MLQHEDPEYNGESQSCFPNPKNTVNLTILDNMGVPSNFNNLNIVNSNNNKNNHNNNNSSNSNCIEFNNSFRKCHSTNLINSNSKSRGNINNAYDTEKLSEFHNYCIK